MTSARSWNIDEPELVMLFQHASSAHPTFVLTGAQILKIRCTSTLTFTYSGDPVSDRLTKRTIPEYGPPFFSPKYFPAHIMYIRFRKGTDPRFGSRTTLFSPKSQKDPKNGPAKKKITLLQLYTHQLTDELRLDSLMGPTVAGSAKGPALA